MSSEPIVSRLQAHADVRTRQCNAQSRQAGHIEWTGSLPGSVRLLPSAERVTAICIEPRLSEAFHDDGYVNHGFRNDDRDEYLSPRALWLCSARNRRVDQISALLILPSWLGAPRTPALL